MPTVNEPHQNPLVTVVVPCYNAQYYIRECLQSIHDQNYRPIEIIVIDDCSTDSSFDIINEFVKENLFVTAIKNETNRGECYTSNRGFRMARGKYVCRLSADDAFAKFTHLERQVQEMEQHELDWCYNNINLVGETMYDSVKGTTAWAPIPIRYSADFFHVFDNTFLKFPNYCYLISVIRNPINSSALMFRTKSYIDKLSWESTNTRSCCDFSLLASVFLKKLRGRAIHELGSFYRIHSEQATGKPETNKDLAYIRKWMLNTVSHKPHPLWMRWCARKMEKMIA